MKGIQSCQSFKHTYLHFFFLPHTTSCIANVILKNYEVKTKEMIYVGFEASVKRSYIGIRDYVAVSGTLKLFLKCPRRTEIKPCIPRLTFLTAYYWSPVSQILRFPRIE